MRGSVLTYPLSYLSLRDEGDRRLFRRNWVTVLFIVIFMSAPFVFFNANYFSDKGFLDRIGGFAAVLTGFYIAALVGVASFASSVGDLDEEIEVGRISRPVLDQTEYADGRDFLTRRQYVCSMFGYLAFMSLVLSIGAIVLIVVAEPMHLAIGSLSRWLDAGTLSWIHRSGRAIVIIGFNIILVHLLVTTCHGLYYLIDRLYAKKPKLLSKSQKHPQVRVLD